MKDLRKIMLIASIFPPSWGSGVHRISKIYKYLPDFGYFPVVLTTTEDSYGIIDPSIDHHLKRGLIIRSRVFNWGTLSSKIWVKAKGKSERLEKQPKKNVFKNFTMHFFKNIYNNILIPDDRVLWIPIAIIKGYFIIRKHRIELLFSTSPHHSCHIVALFLKRMTGLPWVVDFRDPWTNNPFHSNRLGFQRFFENLFERWVVKNSSKIVSISEPITEELKKRYSDMDLKKFDVLPNSFDPDDFKDLSENRSLSNKFMISHAGTFYGNRFPDPFLKALIKLVKQNPHWRNKIEVYFIGSFPQNRESLALLELLGDVVTFIPYLPYKDMLKFLARSTLLLLIPGPGEGTITGKVFDYLALKKPILLLSQENIALENILRKTQNSIIIPYNTIDKTVESLTLLIQKYFRNGTIKMEINEKEICLFTSIEMTRKFSGIMDELLKVDKRRFARHDKGHLPVRDVP